MEAADGRSAAQETLSLWLTQAGRCAMLPEPLACPKDGEVLVRSLFSGISRGTEALVFRGLVPENQHREMRGPHMGGDFSFPVKYGYAAVGVIEQGPEARLGETVFCLHPHQQRFVVTQEEAHALPDGLPPPRAVLAANMETALNIVWDANILPGDRVAVFGAGVIGALAARLSAQIPGTRTMLIDRDGHRAALAMALEADFATPDGISGEFDVLINATASDAALAQAIAHAGLEARIVEASWYGEGTASLPLGGAFHARRLSIVSSQVGHVPAARRARWSFSRRLAKALELLRDDRLDALISGETDFAAIAGAYPGILADSATLCHRIHY